MGEVEVLLTPFQSMRTIEVFSDSRERLSFTNHYGVEYGQRQEMNEIPERV